MYPSTRSTGEVDCRRSLTSYQLYITALVARCQSSLTALLMRRRSTRDGRVYHANINNKYWQIYGTIRWKGYEYFFIVQGRRRGDSSTNVDELRVLQRQAYVQLYIVRRHMNYATHVRVNFVRVSSERLLLLPFVCCNFIAEQYSWILHSYS